MQVLLDFTVDLIGALWRCKQDIWENCGTGRMRLLFAKRMIKGKDFGVLDGLIHNLLVVNFLWRIMWD
jgi:hypothetical protein